MTPEDETRARDIFSRPAKLWTKDENKFLDALMKQGLRQRLKDIRKEVSGE